jgi:hypothetical protein
LRDAGAGGGVTGQLPDQPPGSQAFLVGGEGGRAYPDVGRARVEVAPDPGRDGLLVADQRQVGGVADALALEDGRVGDVAGALRRARDPLIPSFQGCLAPAAGGTAGTGVPDPLIP